MLMYFFMFLSFVFLFLSVLYFHTNLPRTLSDLNYLVNITIHLLAFFAIIEIESSQTKSKPSYEKLNVSTDYSGRHGV